jgi:hypothetical protein
MASIVCWQTLSLVALAAVALWAVCAIRGIGIGDLKLCGAALGVALMVVAIAGGLIATVRGALCGEVKIVRRCRRRGIWLAARPHPTLAPGRPGARGMPYAPAILIGTFFAS